MDGQVKVGSLERCKGQMDWTQMQQRTWSLLFDDSFRV